MEYPDLKITINEYTKELEFSFAYRAAKNIVMINVINA
jgi:hypothetical protein